ncbi:hypothetical protein ACHMW7_24055 [Aminobacter sp. UC22_36]|uniref:hypothetical protein n=1 Tax=Aminobacter sp. UC22_36 TaxID=3374549 RepID=UPI00375677A2
MHDYREAIKGYVDQEAVLFFCLFSRIEFALKRGGFLRGQVGDKAEPHWDGFANALGNDFFDELAKAPQVSIFFKQQPKRLVVKAANEVEFVKPADIKNLQMLFEAVRLVRNNLFHGEKVYVSQRDLDLMEASIFILNAAINACSENDQCKAVPVAFMFASVAGYP